MVSEPIAAHSLEDEMGYSHEKLIDPDTGEFDHSYIMEQAKLRAAREWDGPDFPASYLRSQLLDLHAIAAIMRKRWRDDRHLPDDTKYVAVEAYGKHHDGVRREAF
jgi:hypothetical protein